MLIFKHIVLLRYQTALIHAKENKRSGKTTLTKSEGECLLNQAGGVGHLGSFGDVTSAHVSVGEWTRVVVSLKAANPGDNKAKVLNFRYVWN